MKASDKNNKEDKMSANNSPAISVIERKRIQEALERTDVEKFHLFTRMMRIHFMLQNAVIIKK